MSIKRLMTWFISLMRIDPKATLNRAQKKRIIYWDREKSLKNTFRQRN